MTLRLILIIVSILLLTCGDADTPYIPAPESPPVADPVADPIPIPEPVLWQPPTTQGLHLILERNTKQEYFASLRVKDGLLLGTYGAREGGPYIQKYDGSLTNEAHFPDRESVLDLYMPDDNLALATTELYASVFKRSDSGWAKTYSRSRQQDLMFYIRKMGDALYANWNSFDLPVSGLIKSTDNGETWTDHALYAGKLLYGMGSSGTAINLAGQMDGYPVMTNIYGTVLVSRPDHAGYSYWGIACAGDVWSIGGWNGSTGGFIDAFDGTALKKVYVTDRHYIHAINVKDGYRYAVATWGWDATSGTSLLLRSKDGYQWTEIANIPCPHIIGMSFGDNGIYLAGGRYRDFGRVYFYRF